MRPVVQEILKHWVTWYQPEGPILEVGSFKVEPSDDLRPIFGARPYVGVDLEAGGGVDLQADGCALPLRNDAVGCVVSADALEHVAEPWRFVPELYRVLRPGGYLFVLTVFWFPIHYQRDYWRFTPDALELLLARAGATSYGSWYMGPEQIPHTVGAVARKDARVPHVLDISLRVPEGVPL
jgi:SAM-dependent methyltransferase